MVLKRKAIKTLLEAHLTTESPAQAWALAYRAAAQERHGVGPRVRPIDVFAIPFDGKAIVRKNAFRA